MSNNNNNIINNQNGSPVILNAASIAASASKSASAGIYSPTKNDKSKQFNLNNNFNINHNESISSFSTSTSCLNNHTLFNSNDDETFIKDNKLLHQIGTNLVDLSVCWHKMSSDLSSPNGSNQNNQPKSDNTTENTINLFEKINPILDDHKTDEQTKKSFQEEFSSLIIKSTYNSTGFDASMLLEANKNQSPAKLADQIGFITSGTRSSTGSVNISTKDLIEQIKLFNKYNTSKFTELNYELLNDDNLMIKGLVKIYWNLKNPIKLSTENWEAENDPVSNRQTSFKATSIKDLKKNKKQQGSFDDSYSKADEKIADKFFRSQTVKSKPNKWKRPTIMTQDEIKEIKETKEDSKPNSENDQMFVPSYGSMSSVIIDNRTTCLKAVQILLEKFHIETSPDNFSLYKVYQSGDIIELDGNDLPLIQRVLMGPFNEDKIFIMEKGRNLNRNQDIANLICLPEPLLKGLVDSSKKEEQKEINAIKQKFKTFSDLLKNRLKSLN